MSMRAGLEAMLAAGRDSPMLRLSLGNECMKAGEHAQAVAHLEQAVELDPQYSAAWRQLGRALAEAGDGARAAETFRRGIAVAESRGDKQAAKEMTVFLRRLERKGSA